MVKDSAISVRLDSALKTALEKAASADHRPLANLVQVILREWAVSKGHLKPDAEASGH